jgi:hypothetical protein
VAKPHFAAWVGPLPSRLVGAMPRKVLGCEKGRALAALRHLVIPEGRAWAIHDALREVWPRRFTAAQPAAVALHPPMDWRCDAPMTGVLTPDTAHAQAF